MLNVKIGPAATITQRLNRTKKYLEKTEVVSGLYIAEIILLKKAQREKSMAIRSYIRECVDEIHMEILRRTHNDG
jgi:hypothetical protein